MCNSCTVVQFSNHERHLKLPICAIHASVLPCLVSRVIGSVSVRMGPCSLCLAPSFFLGSSGTFNQEGEVSSIVEIEGTPLAAGDEGAAVEVAATDFQGFLKETAEVADQ